MPRLIDQIPRGSLPNDEYGDGHMMVNPRYSKRTNMNIAAQSPGDGNLRGLEENYGSSKYPSGDYLETGKGLNPRDMDMYRKQSKSFDQTAAEMRDLFGDETAAEILSEVLRVAAYQDMGGKVQGMQAPDRMMGEGMPAPDFGNQQPYTTGPAGDGDMMALEQYYGYPVSANNLTGNPNAPVRNMPGGGRKRTVGRPRQ